MHRKSRALDSLFIEKFWRSIKYDDILVRAYKAMEKLVDVKLRQKKSPEKYQGLECLLAELNHGHRDFQSLALPTELRRRVTRYGCKDRVNC